MPEGIVLVRIPFREHDEIISFITREIGRVDVLARGVKKITSKLSPHLEPFSHVSFDTVEGKEMTVLTSSQILDSFSGVRSHYTKSLQAEFASHAVYKLTRPGNIEQGVFDTFFSWLRVVDTIEHISDCRFLDWFMFQIMSTIGFEPAYRACVYCGGSENLLSWSFSQGGVVCARCASNDLSGGSLFRISPQTIRDMDRLHHISVADLSVTYPFIPTVHSLLSGHLQYQTEAKIGGWIHTGIPVGQLA